MFLQRTVFAVAASLAAFSAQADVGITAGIGTGGPSLHLVVPMENNLNGRFGVSQYKRSFEHTSNDIDFKGDAKLQTADVLFDWHMFSGSFRLTAGLIYNGNEVSAEARPTDGSFTINGNKYDAKDVGTLNGKIDFQKAAPYLGIGWGNALAPNSRWSFSTDIGAIYHGNGHVALASQGCTVDKDLCGKLAADVAAERSRLTDSMADVKFWPVVRFGVSYRF